MFTAFLSEEGLCAPTVGRFAPAIALGSPLVEGLLLGTVLRAGRRVEVRAPKGVAGVATQVITAGSWVEHGTVLAVPAEGSLAGQAATAAAPREADVPDDVEVVRADTDGTVYLRPEPGAAAFAPDGSGVAAHGTLALVEVMKTFSPVRSPIAGVVRRVCVDDGASVEAGAALFWVGQAP